MKPLRQLTVVPTLPPNLEPLRELALNLWWTWDREALDLFHHLDAKLWEKTYHNPIAMLGQISQERLDATSKNSAFLARLEVIHKKFREYHKAPSWFETNYKDGTLSDLTIAYFSMEYGLTECMPLYSGGLGVLAGDHLKSTSYLGLPFVAVGLLYQHGYFRQTLTADGWQMADYPTNDFYNMPIQPATLADGSPLFVEIEYPEGKAIAKVWCAQVGRVRLYLLDTNIPENQNEELRSITDYLYGGDERLRIKQEILLGIGGYRALAALGIQPTVCHINEGHAAFLAIERIRQMLLQTGIRFEEACEATRAGNIFTTHTPVPAGIDWFPPDLVNHYFSSYYRELGISMDTFLGLGRTNPSNTHSEFSPALLALRLSALCNGVSQLHGQVAVRCGKTSGRVPLCMKCRLVPLPTAFIPVHGSLAICRAFLIGISAPAGLLISQIRMSGRKSRRFRTLNCGGHTNADVSDSLHSRVNDRNRNRHSAAASPSVRKRVTPRRRKFSIQRR